VTITADGNEIFQLLYEEQKMKNLVTYYYDLLVVNPTTSLPTITDWDEEGGMEVWKVVFHMFIDLSEDSDINDESIDDAHNLLSKFIELTGSNHDMFKGSEAHKMLPNMISHLNSSIINYKRQVKENLP